MESEDAGSKQIRKGMSDIHSNKRRKVQLQPSGSHISLVDWMRLGSSSEMENSDFYPMKRSNSQGMSVYSTLFSLGTGI